MIGRCAIGILTVLIVSVLLIPGAFALSRYDISAPNAEVNITSASCQGSKCHLVTENKAGTTTPNNLQFGNVLHPGADRAPAASFPEWVHGMHGDTSWPQWRMAAWDDPNQRGFPGWRNITSPLVAVLNSGSADITIGSGSNPIGPRRLWFWKEYGFDYEAEILAGDQEDGDNTFGNPSRIDFNPETIPGCAYSLTATWGCHGVQTYDLDDSAQMTSTPRTDTIGCTTNCHDAMPAVTSTNNQHGTTAGAQCNDCHQAGTALGATSPVVRQCYECHTITPRNTTGLHAGKDCEDCHGHGHNVTYKTTWSTTCGSQGAGSDEDDYCHGSSSSKSIAAVDHNVSAGNSPNCGDCHVPSGQKAHNITIPACNKCHNSTSTWGVAQINGTGDIPGWDSSNTYHGSSSKTCEDCHMSTAHSTPSKPTSCGISDTNCHEDGGSAIYDIDESHSTLSCTDCHNNETIKSYSSNGTKTINTNFHATDRVVTGKANMTPFNMTGSSGTVNSTCKTCHDNTTYIIDTLACEECHTDDGQSKFTVHSYSMQVDATLNDGTHSTATEHCSDCHDASGGSSSNTGINFSSVNASGANHRLLNQNATTGTTNDANKICWGCHDTDGEPVEGGHPDKQKTPWTCPDCHLNVTGVYAGPNWGTYPSAPTVKEHFPKGIDSSLDARETDSDYLMTNTSWNSQTERNATCEWCHRNDLGDTGGTEFNTLTNYLLANVSHYGKNTSLPNTAPDTADCEGCHRGTATVRYDYGVGPSIDNGTAARQDHTGRTTCNGCHHNDEVSESFHEEELDLKGGSETCTQCHRTGDAQTYPDVNFTAFNESIHRWINNASEASGNESIERACRGCHVTNGEAQHKNRDPPYLCWDCHNGTAPYSNVSNAPTVAEHYNDASDLNISKLTGDINSSCIACHNKTEMLNTFTEDDSGGSGNGSFSNVSHYGKKRGDDLRYVENSTNVTSCTYCHQNASTAFSDVMAVTNRKGMYNHTDRTGSPTCSNSTCHNQGRMHDADLTKPQFNYVLCTSCHTDRQNHSGSIGGVSCPECHTNTSKGGWDIHGINGSYLQSSGNAYGGNGSAVNCATCHQGTGADGKTTTQPKIPSPMNHSNNETDEGGIWSPGDPYWTTGNQLSACSFCHGDTKHDTNALGNASSAQGSDSVNNTGFSTSTWCGSCHYKNDGNYTSTQAALEPDPPEITNDSWNNIGVPRYYNHSFSDGNYNDSKCDDCHTIGSPVSMDEFMHNVQIGVAGGRNCTQCHDLSGSAPKHVNISAINSSNAIHNNLNSGSVDAGVDPRNRICWACHGTGDDPGSGHPAEYKNPWTCYDCHVEGGANYGNYAGAKNVSEHFNNATDVNVSKYTGDVNFSCVSCHYGKSEMILLASAVNDPDTGSFTIYSTYDGGNVSASHYGKKRHESGDGLYLDAASTNCAYCHQNSTTAFSDAMENTVNINLGNHTNNTGGPYCTNSTCHDAGRIHDAALTIPFKDTGGMYNSSLCKACHGGKEVHGVAEWNSNTLECASCHADPGVYSASGGGAAYFNITYDRVTKNSSGTYTGNESPATARVGDPPAGRGTSQVEAGYQTLPQRQELGRFDGLSLRDEVSSFLSSILKGASFFSDTLEVYTPKDRAREVPIDLITERNNFGANEQPEFDILLRKNSLRTLWTGRGKIRATLIGPSGKELKLEEEVRETEKGFRVKLDKGRAFRPGLYTLRVETTQDGVTTVKEQDFTWGVLAINTHKSIYLPTEEAFIGIAVLDDEGRMVCDAEVVLTITDPMGVETTLSTEDGSIVVSEECSYYGVTDLPDYYTNYKVKGIGSYRMDLTAITEDGERSIVDEFEVQSSIPFDVARDGPTRIYPLVPYTMSFMIKANEDYSGPIREYVPSSFEITPQEGLEVKTIGDTKVLSWGEQLKKGQTYILAYEFDAPDISPEFYVLGKLEIGSWKEAREWMIASDTTVQDDGAPTASPNPVNQNNNVNISSRLKGQGGGGAACDPSCDVWMEDDGLMINTTSEGVADFYCTGSSQVTIVQCDPTGCSVNADCSVNIPLLGQNAIVVINYTFVASGTPAAHSLQAGGTEGTFADPVSVTIQTSADNPPTWQNQGQNVSTINVSGAVNLSAEGNDDNGLWQAQLETNESGGTWNNQTCGASCYGSPMDLGNVTTWTWSNFTWSNSSVAPGTTVGWRIWYRDNATTSNWNATDIMTFDVVDQVPPVMISKFINESGTVSPGTYVCLNATVTDNWQIDDVWAVITYSNGTLANLTMLTSASCASGDTYGVEVNVSSVEGTFYFNASYANDTVGNIDSNTTLQSLTVSSVGDVNPPWFSQNQSNNTIANSSTLFSVYWQDDGTLDSYVFGTNNTGAWVNETYPFGGGDAKYSNITKTLNNTVGAMVEWQVWANDSTGKMNTTGLQYITTTAATWQSTLVADGYIIGQGGQLVVPASGYLNINDTNGATVNYSGTTYKYAVMIGVESVSGTIDGDENLTCIHSNDDATDNETIGWTLINTVGYKWINSTGGVTNYVEGDGEGGALEYIKCTASGVSGNEAITINLTVYFEYIPGPAAAAPPPTKDVYRYYVKFDISTIPAGADITEANLTLNITVAGPGGEIGIVNGSKDVQDGADNDTVHGGGTLSTGGTFDVSSLGEVNVTVTSIVQAAVTNGQSYAAFQVRALDESNSSQNFTIAGNGSNGRPKLFINYTASPQKQIHGIRYIEQDGTYSDAYDNSSVANCASCHQGTTITQVNGTAPPKIPLVFNHSNNESAGNLWGSYWNDSDGVKTNDSCWYCHGDTKHNATGLGNVSIIPGTVNGSINDTSIWCRSCHYNESPYYKGDVFSPRPPEITNDTGEFYNVNPGYYENHSGSSYLGNDSTCKSCHQPSPAPSNMTAFMHNVQIGVAGGRDCVSCHDTGKGTQKLDVGAMNQSGVSIHAGVNS
ncbi:MAG: hypothetical protein V3T58_06670, partial [Candidatus Hydrothermarchaeales archaeon]